MAGTNEQGTRALISNLITLSGCGTATGALGLLGDVVMGLFWETKQDVFDKIFPSGAAVFDTRTCRGFSTTRQSVFDGSVAPDTNSNGLMNFK